MDKKVNSALVQIVSDIGDVTVISYSSLIYRVEDVIDAVTNNSIADLVIHRGLNRDEASSFHIEVQLCDFATVVFKARATAQSPEPGRGSIQWIVSDGNENVYIIYGTPATVATFLMNVYVVNYYDTAGNVNPLKICNKQDEDREGVFSDDQ